MFSAHSRFRSPLSRLARSVHAQSAARARIAQIDQERPYQPSVDPALIDSFRREHNYLRISLTEKCNLRCFYCMPEEGVELSPKDHILTNDEILRLARLFVQSGVTKIRLTGGEPTIRKGILELITGLNSLREHGLKSIAMTTNGIAVHRKLPAFVENGLSHINISLDTLDPFKFEIMARRPGHESVLQTLNTALQSQSRGLTSVKLNMVVIKGLNDSEVLDFVEMTKENDLSVRFIEFMPFTGNKWDARKMVPSNQLLERVRERHPNIARASDELNDVARSWQIPGYKGSIGFISSMSDHFCATCNRLRITADGQIKVCLFDAKEVSLRDLMRKGASDSELLDLIGTAVWGKKAKHAGMENIDVVTNRPMILIGASTVSYVNIPMYPVGRAPLSSRHSRVKLWQLPTTTAFNPGSIRMNSTHAPKKHLTHLDKEGRASMVDVSDKGPTKRTATAVGSISIPKIAYDLVTETYPTTEMTSSIDLLEKAKAKARRKGDALTIAQLAAIMGSKRTADLIPLCHPLALSHVNVTVTPEIQDGQAYSISVCASVTCEGKTGVEMEALTAVSVGLLTVWDMLKAVAGKEMEIKGIKVVEKTGGKSGDFQRDS